MLYVLTLNVRTYCVLYVLAPKNSNSTNSSSIVLHLFLAIFVVYWDNGLTQQLLVLGTWFYEHPYCTDSDISFLFLLTNVLIVSCFG